MSPSRSLVGHAIREGASDSRSARSIYCIFFDILSLNIRCPVLRGRCRCKKLSATASTDSAKLSWAVAIAGHFADYG